MINRRQRLSCDVSKVTFDGSCSRDVTGILPIGFAVSSECERMLLSSQPGPA